MPGREQDWLVTSPLGRDRLSLGTFARGGRNGENGSVFNLNLEVALTEVETCGSGPALK